MSNQNIELGIALSGGGLQGFAHIGALKALEEIGVNIKYVSGTSTGSVIASLYAMGYNTDEIEKICKENYKKLLKIRKLTLLKMAKNFMLHKETKVEGIINGKVVEDFVNDVAKTKNVDLIKDIRTRKLAIATVDTISMKECIFTSDKVKQEDKNINYISNINIGTAVHASMAFPAIFTTASFGKYNFIDGGTVDNLPTKVLKDLGATKIIAICFDVTNYTPSKSLEGVIIRTLDIFSNSDVEQSKKIADVSIEIYNPDTSLLTMNDIKKTIENGYNSVINNKDKILSIL